MDTHDHAVRLFQRGWHPLPIPANAKSPPPTGTTGRNGHNYNADEIDQQDWSGNIATRMPFDVVALDIDVYKGGDKTLSELLTQCGDLPPTWVIHNGRGDGSGIRLFRAPNMPWITGLPGFDIIQHRHRFAMLPPSNHPDGRRYEIYDQQEDAPADTLPDVDDLPELPWPWIAALARAHEDDTAHVAAASGQTVQQFVRAYTTADQPAYLSVIVDHWTGHVVDGYSRHDTTQHALIWAMEAAAAEVIAAEPAIRGLGNLWTAAFNRPGDNPRRAALFQPDRVTEWTAMVRYAVAKALAKPQHELNRIHDDICGIRINPPPEPDAPAADTPTIWVDWHTLFQDASDERTWLIDHVWPYGRSIALFAAAKEGKSELALWCAVHLAIGRHPWTGQPAEPIDVAYFDYEMTEDDLRERISTFNVEPGDLARLHYALLPPLHPLDSQQGGSEILAYVQDVHARAVIIDTFGRAVVGPENDADTVRNYYRHTGSRLKALGVGSLRSDHAGKDVAKGQRGTSAKREDVDVIWTLRRGGSGVDLDCSSSSRLSWVGPFLHLDRFDTDDGYVRYATPVRMAWPEGTADKANQMDAIGLPVNATKRAAMAALKDAYGTAGRNETVLAALQYRRERVGPTAGTTKTASGTGTTDPPETPEARIYRIFPTASDDGGGTNG